MVSEYRRNVEKAVISLVGEDNQKFWWNSHNLAFDMTTEQKWLEDPDAVLAYVRGALEGEW